MKAYSLAIARQAESSEPEEPVVYESERMPEAVASPAEAAPAYDTEQDDANANLDKLFAAAGKKGAGASPFGLSLAQKSMPKNDVLIEISHKSKSLETGLQSLLDDALAGVEIDGGEDSAAVATGS